MLKDIAQKLAISTSNIIGYKVIITDENSIIIGSTDITRLGTLHEASINILKTGHPNPDNIKIELLQGTKDGFSLPIEIIGKKIGTFGITGKREDVKGYCYLLKEYIETMLYHEMYMKTQIFKEQSIENLIKQIILFDPKSHDEDYVLLRGEELGCDLDLPRIVIIIDFYQFERNSEQVYKKMEGKTMQSKEQHFKREIMSIINNTMKDTKDIVAPFLEDKFVILGTIPEMENELDIMNIVKEKCKKMITQFEQKKISIRIGIGIIGKGVIELQESYKAARRALELGVKDFKKNEIYYFHDFVLEDLSSYARNSLSHKYINQLLTPLKSHPDWKELTATISAWCDSGFSQKKAADMLHIHRNTLYHRLNKINQITKLDPMNFREIHLLYMGIIMSSGNNK